MKISIITPSFNSENTIARTLESISKQSLKVYEYILVDNLSSDRTLEIAKKWAMDNDINLHIISEKDKGISDAFTKGVNFSTGDIIGILNSDDEYYTKDALLNIKNAFVENHADYVHGDMLFLDDLHGSNIRKPLLCSLEEAMPYNHPAFFVKKSVYNEVGAFDLQYKYAMDFDLICRMYKTPTESKYIGHYLQGEPIVKMHAGGVSWSFEMNSIDELEKILRGYGFYSNKARFHLFFRRFRIKLKGVLGKLHLDGLVIRLWRKFKWT